MAAYDRNQINSTLEQSESAESNTERGRLLESLMVYLLGECNGVRHQGSNRLNAAGSSEIDVCFWNNQIAGSLDFLPRILVLECKNTVARVGSGELRIFLAKLQEMRLTCGIFVASHGITGNADDLRSAHDVVRTAFQRSDIRVLVITKREIEELTTAEELTELLQNKYLTVTMQANSFTS